MPKQHLLVADADPESLRVLAVSLRNAGFTVTTAATGRDALERCRFCRPDLVICDTELPGMNGFEVCRTVRGDARLRGIPFIFLTRENRVEDKVKGLELGVEEFLAKPVYVREAVTRVTLLLERRAKELLTAGDPPVTTSGDLATMGIVDLVQTLGAARKTALVRVTRADGRSATMGFHEGRLESCELGRLRDAAAFYRLLQWRDGRFVVEVGAATGSAGTRAGGIQADTHEVLMEGMRRLDEWGRLVEQLPPLDRAFQIDYRLLSDRLAEIPDDVNGLLKLVDGRRTLEEVIDAAVDHDDLAAATVLSKLYFEGIIAPAAPPGGAAREPARAATPAPDGVDWFAGPAGPDAPPRGVPREAADGAPVSPRIVRFPPRPRPAPIATQVPAAGGAAGERSEASGDAAPGALAAPALAAPAPAGDAVAEARAATLGPAPAALPAMRGSRGPRRRRPRYGLAIAAVTAALLAAAALVASRAHGDAASAADPPAAATRTSP